MEKHYEEAGGDECDWLGAQDVFSLLRPHCHWSFASSHRKASNPDVDVSV